MLTQATALSRWQMIRAVNAHMGLALLSGALTGLVFYWLNGIEAEGYAVLALALPILAVYVNGAALPAVVPGRHWSFGFIGMMMLACILVAGMMVERTFSFPFYFPNNFVHETSQGAPLVTCEVGFAAVETGACLGLLYGLICGRTMAMVTGLVFGCLGGLILGAWSHTFIGLRWPFAVSPALIPSINEAPDVWRKYELSGYLWRGAFSFGLLHLLSGFGAALGAARAPDGPGTARAANSKAARGTQST